MLLSFTSPSLPLCENNHSLLVCVPLGWILNRTVSIVPRKYAWAYACSHTPTACLPSVPTALPMWDGWSHQPGTHPWYARRGYHPPAAKEDENHRERRVTHGTRLLGRRKPATVWRRKKGKSGESRTPDSRERTETMTVIREGGEIGQESYTLTSPSKTENWTACFE